MLSQIGIGLGKAQGSPGIVVPLGGGFRQAAYPKDIALALSDTDGMSGIQKVERVGGLHHLLIGRQRQFAIHQPHGLMFTKIKGCEQRVGIGLLEVIGRHFHLVLVEHIPIGHYPRGRLGPDQVIYRGHVLQVHGDALQAVGDFPGHGKTFQATGLLEIGELGDFHTVEPDFPAQAPGAQGR